MDDHSLLGFITQHVSPTDEEWADLVGKLQIERFSKGDKLIVLGRPCARLYFVVEGLARHYFYNLDHEEMTTWFSGPGGLITDYASFTINNSSKFEVQALTNMSCFCIDHLDLAALYDQSKTWERLGRLINQTYLIQLIERNNSMFTKSARQRYQEFFQQHGHLFNIVPLKHIASYLGITIETLSRLRNNSY